MYYIDNKGNTDPRLNLALEEYAVRNLDINSDFLLLYMNQPCVIIGKHQNILEEVNLADAGDLGVPIIRRISGGGTVYHDTGNLNISFITKQTFKNFNKYINFLKPVLEVLKELNLDAHLNERNNIILKDCKISGNAQFTSRQRLLSHGTLLVNSDLAMIDRLIKSENTVSYLSKSTKSVRSRVTNINDNLKQDITSEEIKQKILSKIFGYDIDCFEIGRNDWTEIEKLAEQKYKSWEWNYGLSPECKISKSFNSDFGKIDMELAAEKGIIQSFTLINSNITDKNKEAISRYFNKQRLDFITIKEIERQIEKDQSSDVLNKLPWIDILLN